MKRLGSFEGGGHGRSAMTLIELIVVIFIIGLLVALTVMAVQYSRASSRNVQCKSHLKQLALGCIQYEGMHRVFPPGTVMGVNFHVAMLPYLDQMSLYEKVRFGSPDPAKEIKHLAFSLLRCPADGAPRVIKYSSDLVGGTNYVGNAGTWVNSTGFDGMFRYWIRWGRLGGPPIASPEVTDGLSVTSLLSETIRADNSFARPRVNWNLSTRFRNATEMDALSRACNSLPKNPRDFGWGGSWYHRGTPWVEGGVACTLYNHVSTPGNPTCYNGTDVTSAAATASSFHGQGANVAFADGHVEFVSSDVSALVWRAFGSRFSPQ